MSTIITITQAYNHNMATKSGFAMHYALQYRASAATSATFYKGALVSLDSSGNIETGCGDADMPMWANNGTADYGVALEAEGVGGGVISAWPATGGFEIATTEYDTDGTYAPNQLLTADTVTSGYVTESPAAYNTAVIVGIVSEGVKSDYNSISMLNFWTMFIPTVKTS